MNEIVVLWIEEFTAAHGVKSLNEIPKNAIEEEIAEVKGTIDNCKIFGDRLSVVCNEEYLEYLMEAAEGN